MVTQRLAPYLSRVEPPADVVLALRRAAVYQIEEQLLANPSWRGPTDGVKSRHSDAEHLCWMRWRFRQGRLHDR